MTEIDPRRKWKSEWQEKELVIFKLFAQPTSQKFPLPYLDPDSLATELCQIFKPKIMLILHTCILNVSIEVERNISQLILWGSITLMTKLEVSYFVEFSTILLHPVFAHDKFHVLHLWEENDRNDTVFI